MDYTKLAKEARKLYDAFRNEHFDENQSYYLTKVCVQDYPIFREMIKKDGYSENYDGVVGYVYFANDHRDPIYEVIEISPGTIEVRTEEDAYRQVTISEYRAYEFTPRTVTEYFKYEDKDWKQIHFIDYIKLF